jgi:ketosteroid isomerase-like protein
MKLGEPIMDDFQELFEAYVSSYRARDAAGCASVYSSDAELYSPYGPAAIGRAAIEAAHREWVEEGGEHKKIIVMSEGRSGDLGWCMAHYSEGSTGNGTSLNILERQPDGNWLITHCSLNEAL